MIIGITGGVGSGKSTVLSYIKEKYDSIILLTDDIAKELQQPNQISYNLIVKHFGKQILKNDNTIDSKKLAEIVFNNKEELEILNSFCHPYVTEYIKNIININKNKLIFIESALLLDTELKDLCDEIWYIKVDIELRRDRLKRNRNYSNEKINNMIQSQKSEEYFLQYSNFIIENNDMNIMQNMVDGRLGQIK